MPKVKDVTDAALDDVMGVPFAGTYIRRVQAAKPATKLTPTLQATLDEWNRRADKSLPFVSRVLAYGFRYMKPSQHANMIRLIKGKHLRLCQVSAPPPEGSNARRETPYSDHFYLLRESCPSELPEGQLAGKRRR